MDGDATGELTLAFSLSALDRLDDPRSAFEEAQQWSRFLGVVDNNREAVGAVVADHDLRQDFEQAEDEDIWLAMERIRETTATPRHVYVGVTEENRRVATELGWEFVHVTEAAEKAEWGLDGGDSEAGVGGRFRETIAEWLPGFGDG